MNRILRYKKVIASFFLLLLGIQLVLPASVYALTSGPSQPELKGFEPVSTTDMVDLFSGDFTYNVPLMDVGGYPLNLAYHSGSGMDDEASWVGLGWSLTPGMINRQMRGLPDDFDGDKVEKEFNMKDNSTAGLKLVLAPEIFGAGKTVSLNVGVFKNSYRGFGADVGVNANIGLTNNGAGSLTLGVNGNSQEGATANLGVNFALEVESKNNIDLMPGLSIGASYNSRAGIKGITLGANVDYRARKYYCEKFSRAKMVSNETSYSFAAETYTPTSNVAFSNQSYTLSGSMGVVFFGIHGKAGFTGYYIKQSVANKYTSRSGYGFLHAEHGRKNVNALMDFNREKDNPYNEAVPYLPLPVPTYDLFTVANQQDVSQYRVFRNGSGIFFDPKSEDRNIDASLGVEVGAGGYFQAGVDLAAQSLITRTNKWDADNDYVGKADFQEQGNNEPVFEPAYFKRSGEKVRADADYNASIRGDSVVGVGISLSGDKTRALSRFKENGPGKDITQPIRRNKREIRNHVFSYLTAAEAGNYGLDKKIRSYPKNQLVLQCNDPLVQQTSRVSDYAKAHHISEVTVTDDNGKRFIYGIPAYNKYQEEATFSVDPSQGNRTTGMATYTSQDASINNKKGRDNYFSKEKMPAYAHAYLLTGIVSNDYVDRTGDGISDDDAGTAVKFNYTKLNTDLGWRTPFEKDKANFNEGMLSDPRDDKASYSYGKKETWYNHSIESKTMIALFVTGNREDGLGVANETGGKDTVHQQYLDRIELYSKSDLKQNGSQAVPIKVVHFEYDYSSCPGVPNNSGASVMRNGENINSAKGKLTLKKVYFTFGRNKKGYLNPYKFTYRQTAGGTVVGYGYKQSDRWGIYKNNQVNEGSLLNDFYPYATQNKEKADEFAALWQLEKVNLPSGGSLQVSYESDDYAYVQNKRSQQMCFVKGINTAGQSSGLINAKELLIKLPQPVSSLAEMKYRYFEGVNNLYFRLYVNLDNAGHYEYVPGYGTIRNVRMVDSETAAVELQNIEGVNPAAIASWQLLRMNLPLYAYPGNETVNESSDFQAAIKSLLGAVQRLGELTENFNSRAQRKNFSNSIDLSKSWVRLCSPSLTKLGGGNRVKSIRISDNWQAMSGNNGDDATYGQDYDYTTTATYNGQQLTISSGVASYEPMIGNDENPFRQPFPYTVKGAPLGLNSYSYIEAPIGESFFPSPGVGYSKVTVYNVGADNFRGRTGYTVSEFFTAKDYPTIVESLPIEPKPYKPHPLLKFLKIQVKAGVVVSQGYSIVVNDMHGKPKQEQVYKRGGVTPISSVRYLYKSENQLAGTQKLQNNVLMLAPDGSLQDGRIGEDIELFTDMREQYTQNVGGSLKLSFGAFPLFFFPGCYVYPGVGYNEEYRQFRSASTVKLIQRSGILYKVIKTQEGSSIGTENIAWDSETGEVLLTKTQNEFDDPVYNFSYPAHWVYDGMGPAYRNISVTIKGFSSDTTGSLLTSVPPDVLLPGDELIDVNGDQKAWVMKGNGGSLKLIDKQGRFVAYNNATIKVMRSGRRNMPSLTVGSLTALRNPIKGGKIDIGEFTQVIDAKANTFKEEWPVALRSITPDVTDIPQENFTCPLKYITGLLYAVSDPDLPFNQQYVSAPERAMLNEEYLFAGRQSNITLRTIVDIHRSFGPSGATTGLEQLFNDPFFRSSQASSLKFYVNTPRYRMKCGQKYFYFNTGDTITIGNYLLILNNVHPYLNDAINGYGLPNSKGTDAAYYEGNTNYSTNGSCGCDGAYGYNNKADEKIELAAHHFVDVSMDANGCRIIPYCPSPLGSIINPYTAGMLGNWLPWQQYAYQVPRSVQVDVDNKLKGGTDIRRSGAYTAVTPFWTYNTATMKFAITRTPADPRWIAASEVTQYDNKGQETENKDALNRYSSALFGYLDAAAVAVASNARQHEIAFDGFEDYQFVKKCGVWPDSCSIEGHFDFRKQVWYGIEPTNTAAHSGKYSLKTNKAITVTREIPAPFTPVSFARFDNKGHFIAAEDNIYHSFYPSPNARYMASVWVKGAAVNNTTQGLLQVNVNTSAQPLAVSQGTGPVVEGWRKVEVIFSMPANAQVFSLTLDPKGGEAYFDDVRIHPYNSLLKSYVYNPSNMFLMAELDENNYATFYEYDDEGTLIRVKKETERGIMTLKENRSIYKKQ